MTLDIARLVANVNHRAEHLFEDGYHAVWEEEGYTLDVTNEEGTTYQVNTLFETCTCPFWTEHRGKYACKHLLGWERLLVRQAQASAAELLCCFAQPEPERELAEQPSQPQAQRHEHCQEVAR